MDEFGEEREASRPKRGEGGKMSDRAMSSRPRHEHKTKRTMSEAKRGKRSRAVEELENRTVG